MPALPDKGTGHLLDEGLGLAASWVGTPTPIQLLSAGFAAYARTVLTAKGWQTTEMVRLVLFLCLTLVTAGILLEGAQVLIGTLGGEMAPSARLMAGYLSFHVPGLILLCLFLRRHNRGWSDGFGIHWERPVSMISMALLASFIALGIGYSAQWLSGYLATLFNHESPAQQAILLLREGSLGEQCAIGFFAVVLAPVVEEGLFRGVFYQWIRDRKGMIPALIVSSLVFGLIHFNLMAFLSLTFFGMVMAWLYERTGNLLGCIIAHSLFNLVGFLRAVLMQG